MKVYMQYKCSYMNAKYTPSALGLLRGLVGWRVTPKNLGSSIAKNIKSPQDEKIRWQPDHTALIRTLLLQPVQVTWGYRVWTEMSLFLTGIFVRGRESGWHFTAYASCIWYQLGQLHELSHVFVAFSVLWDSYSSTRFGLQWKPAESTSNIHAWQAWKTSGLT